MPAQAAFSVGDRVRVRAVGREEDGDDDDRPFRSGTRRRRGIATPAYISGMGSSDPFALADLLAKFMSAEVDDDAFDWPPADEF